MADENRVYQFIIQTNSYEIQEAIVRVKDVINNRWFPSRRLDLKH